MYEEIGKHHLPMCAVLTCPVLWWPHGLQPTRLICPWGFSRQEYWSGLPCPPPRDLPNPGDWIQVSHLAGGFFTRWAIVEVHSSKAGSYFTSKMGLLGIVEKFQFRICKPWQNHGPVPQRRGTLLYRENKKRRKLGAAALNKSWLEESMS